MADKPFIDIAVLDGVRDALLTGKAAIVFDADLSCVEWANGQAAKLFGYGSISELLDNGISSFVPARRQLLSAFSSDGSSHDVMVRIRSGMSTHLLRAHVSRAIIDDEALVLAHFEDPALGEEPHISDVLAGLDAEDAASAIIDREGQVLASDGAFEALGVSAATPAQLANEVADEEDRLVKRLSRAGESETPVAFGVGRLSEAPWRTLVLALETETHSVDAPEKEHHAGHDYIDVSSQTAFDAPTGPDSAMAVQSSTTLPDTSFAAFDDNTDDEAASQLDDFVFRPSSAPIRFVWKMDQENIFREISPEFVQAVGHRAADILGQSFEQVATRLNLDPDGEIGASLERRDTWSGKSVFWPSENTDLRVPVDLAALPYYSRDRIFEGYRGFGVVRMPDAVIDPDAIGQSFGAEIEVVESPTVFETPAPEAKAPPAAANDPFKGEVPVLRSAAMPSLPTHTSGQSQKLAPSEQAAFDAIGKTLRDANLEASRDEAADDESDETIDLYAADDMPIADESEEVGLPDTTSAEERSGLTPDILDGLPLALLIVSNEQTVFGNASFQIMTGYDDIAELNDRGGLEALVVGPSDQAYPDARGQTMQRPMTLLAADGDRFPARAHMQIVPWEGKRALMFAFEPVDDEPEQTTPYVADDMFGAIADDDDHDVQAPKPSNMVSFPLAQPAKPEIELQQHINELESILDIASDAVVILKQDGTIRSLNGPGEALFGYDKAVLEGKSFSFLFAHESQRTAMDYLRDLSTNAISSIMNEGREVLGREQNGGFIPLFMTMGTLPSTDAVCAVLRDITPWKQTEQALQDAKREAEQASSSKSEFLAKISHEIRTPLNAIIGFSDLIAEERFGPLNNKRYKEYLADINKSGKHVLELVNDLLDISKIEAGKQELSFESVDLNAAIDDAMTMVQPQAASERIIMRSSYDPKLPKVVADIRSVRQIVLNLLSNSVRFTHTGGLIVVSTVYKPEMGVVMRVKDTGIGMTEKEIETALQPFQQVADRTKGASDGTGLGLPLTKALVDANRAEFSIHSEPGRGTIVEILFPQSRVLIS